jgi:hypothetical protein
LRDTFRVEHYAETGGSLLAPLLNNIAGRFEEEAGGAAALDALIRLEETMLDAGMLPSDYCFAVARA